MSLLTVIAEGIEVAPHPTRSFDLAQDDVVVLQMRSVVGDRRGEKASTPEQSADYSAKPCLPCEMRWTERAL